MLFRSATARQALETLCRYLRLLNASLLTQIEEHGDVVVIRYEGPKGGPGMREMLAVTAAITLGVGIYAWRTVPTASLVGTVGWSAILAGAAANVIDRAVDGKVTDYFHTGWWPTFNLADTYITCGVVLLVASLIFESTHDPADPPPAQESSK